MEKGRKNYQLKRRSFISALVLFVQSGAIQVMGFVANLILTILLAPDVFGLYYTVLAIMAVLNYFSDIGLAASLIQKDHIDNDDLYSSFTVQQILIVSICIVGYLLTSYVRSFYKLTQAGVFLYWALLLAFFLSSLKTIPTILLERKVNFVPLSVVQIIENFVFYLSAVLFSLLNFGIHSFTIAALLRAGVGLVAIYIVSPWLPKLTINWKRLKQLLSFGIPFQTNSLLALIKDELVTIYLGKLLGFTQLGFVGWAKKWSAAPQQLVMTNFIRVSFPMFSRLKNDKQTLKKSVEKLLYFMSLILFPALLGLIFTIPILIELIPKYNKWAPALFSLYVFSLSAILSSLSTPLTNLLNAIGQVRLSLVLMLIWTALTWILIPLYISRFGYNGVALAIFTISLTSLFVVYLAKRYVKFNFFSSIKTPFLASLFMAAVLYFLPPVFTQKLFQLILVIVVGFSSYALSLIILTKMRIISELSSLVKLLNSDG